MDNNFLTGTFLPRGLYQLTTLCLQSNLLSGIGQDIRNMSYLATLYLQNNQINSRLSDLFNASTQPSLETIDVGYNQFTGEQSPLSYKHHMLTSLL